MMMDTKAVLGLIKVWWIFYQKILVPAIAVAIVIAIIMSSSAFSTLVSGIGIAFIATAPLFHYIIYDTNNPKEYYFYYNQGLSKKVLWSTTIIFSLMISLILTQI